VVVIGASTAGVAAAQELRQLGFDGRLTLVGDEPGQPYDRTALSKDVLIGRAGLDAIALARPEELAALDASWRLGHAAVALDPVARRIELADGRELRYDGLVLATGSSARTLPIEMPPGVLTLRRLDDALALREALAPGVRVALVGAGFVGLEVAAAAHARGAEATVLELAAAPLAATLGLAVGEALAERHRRQGTIVRCGVTVEGFAGRHRVTGVRLVGGVVVPADVVVLGVGARPSTAWAESSGLAGADGIVCDARLATPADNVVAAGDVVRWPHPDVGGLARVEHFEHAQTSGVAAARRLLLGADAVDPYRPQPFFWSHQYGHVIHVAGFPRADAELELLEGALDDGPFAVGYRADGRRSGVVTLDLPRAFRRLRRELMPEGALT
jgi:3-phenylpropionate/trans-cinnamate dioxygenase ferredoxin reductase component